MTDALQTKRDEYQAQLNAARAEADKALRLVARLEGAVIALDDLLEPDPPALAAVDDTEDPCPATG